MGVRRIKEKKSRGSKQNVGSEKRAAMFKKFQSMDEAFRQVRWLSLGSMLLSAVVSVWAVSLGLSHAATADNRIYLLSDGQVFEALAGNWGDQVPVLARGHLRRFHALFFNLDPDEKAIKTSMGKALYLADGSAKALYDDQVEKGYIGGLIAGNISTSVQLDSISLDLSSQPYAFRCIGTLTLTRSTSVTTRLLVTRGYLRRVKPSDNNDYGFMIERFEVVDNKELSTKSR
jgi:conjugative transposon TraK protein